MGWKTRIARRKAIAVIKIAGTIAIIACLNGFIEYAKVMSENRVKVFYNKPIRISVAKAVTIEEVSTKENAPEKSDDTVRNKIDKLIKVAFEGEDVEHARRIVWCESRYTAGAHNQNPATGDDSVGLSQINLIGNLFPGRLLRAQSLGYTGDTTREALTRWLKVPENNIVYFTSMQRTNGWNAWSCNALVNDPSWNSYDKMIAFLEG